MIKQWNELKATITELRDSGGTGTQQDVCKFLANLMDALEKQMQEPCDDAISRQAAIDEIRKCRFVVDAVGKIRGLPPTQPERKKGQWMGTVCSACGTSVSFYYDCDYCPNCGADMRGKQDD